MADLMLKKNPDTNINQKKFFASVTKELFSTLDIDIALQRTFDFMRTILPIDEMILDYYEPDQHAIVRLTGVSNLGKIDKRKIVNIPNEISITDMRMHIKEGTFIVDNLSENHSEKQIKEIVSNLFEKENISIMGMFLITEGYSHGVILLQTKNKYTYTEKHIELLNLLLEPFSIAISNTKMHQKLLSIKNKGLEDNSFYQEELLQKSNNEIIGSQGGLSSIVNAIDQISSLNNTILLLGETGTGKEVIVNRIHKFSSYRNGPFIKVNCGAIPDTLIDSELFGYEKGSFTGAIEKKKGRFERAHNGTIFLDEIGELPLHAQTRLLRVLQFKEIERLGGKSPKKINVRIIAATHRNLEEMVKKGEFREDLWYRLNIFPIHIPPLRHRSQDIPALVNYFISKKSKELGLQNIVRIQQHILDKLIAYSWPGNVRELENIIERELIIYRGKYFIFKDIERNMSDTNNNILQQQEDQFPTLDEFITSHIKNVLKITKGKISGIRGAAELMQINPNTLRNRMAKLDIK